jgi:hypothetical protein
LLASTRPRATGTPELADAGDALKVDDTEDAVVGFKTEAPDPSNDPAFQPRQTDRSGRAAPNVDRITDRLGRRRHALDPEADSEFD